MSTTWRRCSRRSFPLPGLLSAQMAVDGPINTLNGSGWVQFDNGALYGEPLTRMRVQKERLPARCCSSRR